MRRLVTFVLLVWCGVFAFAGVCDVDTAQTCVGRGRLKVCGNNIENYYYDWNGNSYANDKSQTEFDNRTALIVSALVSLDADVYALCEVECGDQTLEYLAAKMSEANSGVTYVAVDDDTDNVGTTYNKSCFIYRSGKVTPVGSNIAAANSGVYVQRMRIQAFEEVSSGEKFTLSMNHFKAFSGQNAKRLENAQSLMSALSVPGNVADPDILIIGDLNCEVSEEATQLLITNGYEEQLLKWNSNAYSYVYNNNNELIDHVFANASMASQITGAAVWHYNNGGSYGYSDHDPYMVGLSLSSSGGSGGGEGGEGVEGGEGGECETLTENYAFTTGFHDWVATSVTGSTTWNQSSSYGVTINAYSKDEPTENWLISPAVDLSKLVSADLTFNHCVYYVNGDTLTNQTLWVSTDYVSGAPSTATWTQIPIHFAAAKGWRSCCVSVPSAALGSNVHFAFKYTATSRSDANYWEIKSATLDGQCVLSDGEVEDGVHGCVMMAGTEPQVFVVDGHLRVVNGEIDDVALYTLSGVQVDARARLQKGVYVALIGGVSQKVVVRK